MNSEELQAIFDEIKESAKGGSIELLQYIAERNRIALLQLQAGDDVSEVLRQMGYNITLKASIIATTQSDLVDDKIWQAFWQVFFAGLTAAVSKI